jgi:hypothetical protein
LLSHSAAPCSSAFSSEASEKSPSFQPIALSSSSIEARVPEPGLPTLKRLPFRSVEPVDVGFLAGQHGERLGVHREHGAQVAVLAVLLEHLGAVVGVVLPVALRDAEVELAGLDGVDVEDRAAGGFDRAADAVLGAVLVHQAADGAAGGVVHAGDAAGADGDELLLREGAGGGQRPRRPGQRPG